MGIKLLYKNKRNCSRIKNTYIKNHIVMIFVLCFIWLPLILENFLLIKGTYKIYLSTTCVYIILANPLILSIFRFNDPYFKFRLKYYLDKYL